MLVRRPSLDVNPHRGWRLFLRLNLFSQLLGRAGAVLAPAVPRANEGIAVQWLVDAAQPPRAPAETTDTPATRARADSLRQEYGRGPTLRPRSHLRRPLELPDGFTHPTRILAAVHRQLSLQELTWNPSLVPQLDAEIRGYKLKDEHIRQDTVLALALALEHAAQAHHPGADGRIGKVIYW